MMNTAKGSISFMRQIMCGSSNNVKTMIMPSSVNIGGLLNSVTRRGTYQKGKEPMVFVNEYTKVICQGMTGK